MLYMIYFNYQTINQRVQESILATCTFYANDSYKAIVFVCSLTPTIIISLLDYSAAETRILGEN